jgi:hypothetical protein
MILRCIGKFYAAKISPVFCSGIERGRNEREGKETGEEGVSG